MFVKHSQIKKKKYLIRISKNSTNNKYNSNFNKLKIEYNKISKQK